MTKYSWILLFLTATLFFGCDIISEDDRFIEMDEVIPQKNILLVDFTDQRCINCPNAALEVESMKAAYGDALIAVSMHASSRNLPLVTAEGNEYEAHFGISSHPTGLIDGLTSSNNYQTWNGLVLNRYNVESDIKITLAPQYSSETRELNLNTKIESEADYSDLNLLLWIVESGIVAAQSMPSGSVNSEYVHNHVFRSSINETWGESISLVDNYLNLQHQFILSESWNEEKVSVVCFVYKTNTYEVLDVTEIYLIEE